MPFGNEPNKSPLVAVTILMAAAERIIETYHPAEIPGNRSAPYVSMPVALAAFAAGGVFACCVSIGCGAEILLGLGVYVVIAGPLCLAAIFSRTRQMAQAIERTISLEDGDVSVTSDEISKNYIPNPSKNAPDAKWISMGVRVAAEAN